MLPEGVVFAHPDYTDADELVDYTDADELVDMPGNATNGSVRTGPSTAATPLQDIQPQSAGWLTVSLYFYSSVLTASASVGKRTIPDFK